jgi:hypothetical protein
MRGGVVPLGMAALVLAVAPAGGGSSRPLHLGAPRSQAARPIAFVWQKDGARLAALNPKTLRVGKQRTPSLDFVDAWAFEHPDGRVVAIAGGRAWDSGPRPPDAIRFVDLESLTLLPGVIALDGFAQALLWVRPDRLVAVLAPTAGDDLLAATVDPVAHRVLTTTPLSGDAVRVGRSGDSLVLLQSPHDKIGPTRLTIIGGDGTVRSTQLDRVSAGGTRAFDAQGNFIGTQRLPALAVDPQGNRAYVIQPDGPAAEIDLRALTVTYHDLTAPRSILARISAWLTPPAAAKGSTGPQRRGVWLGDGLIAVTGSDDSQVTRADGGIEFHSAAAGLAIVDTHDWTVRMLDGRADTVIVTDGRLLATAISSDHGMGLAVYGPDRRLKFSLFRPWVVWVEAALAGRAYVNTYNVYGVRRISIINLATGKIIGKRRGTLPTPVLADGPDWY